VSKPAAVSRRTSALRLLVSVLALSIGAVAAFGVSETYFRCCAPPLTGPRNIHPDAQLGWDSDPAIAPLDNAGRATVVYFAGDSFTQDRSWPRIAQREAARLGVPLDGYSVGVSGYGTTQEWLKIEREYPAHRPALVVLQLFAWNDLRDNVAYPPIAYGPTVFDRPFLERAGSSYALVTPPPSSGPVSAITATRTWRRVLFKIAARADDGLARFDVDALARRRFRGPINYTERSTWEPFYRPDLSEGDYVQSAYGVTRESFRRLKRFLGDRGSRLLVLGLDNPFTVDDDVRSAWIRPGVPFDPGLPLARIAAMLHDEGIAFADARPTLLALARQTGKKVYNPPPGELSGHLEAEGEERFGTVAAQAMAGVLAEMGGRRAAAR
jgi:hypothetical protein